MPYCHKEDYSVDVKTDNGCFHFTSTFTVDATDQQVGWYLDLDLVMADETIDMTKGVCATSGKAYCWMRMPTGCHQVLGETNTPNQWFIDPHASQKTPNEAACLLRQNTYNAHCGAGNAQALWGLKPDVVTGCQYEPIDMATHQATIEGNLAACEKRCADTVGCKFFTWVNSNGVCHITGPSAVRKETGAPNVHCGSPRAQASLFTGDRLSRQESLFTRAQLDQLCAMCGIDCATKAFKTGGQAANQQPDRTPQEVCQQSTISYEQAKKKCHQLQAKTSFFNACITDYCASGGDPAMVTDAVAAMNRWGKTW